MRERKTTDYYQNERKSKRRNVEQIHEVHQQNVKGDMLRFCGRQKIKISDICCRIVHIGV